ncbi:MAG: hypothetical protein MUP36_01255 [Demequinaceae bacterium]|nr:hypothetical protein [Demequinaceae bacterium]
MTPTLIGMAALGGFLAWVKVRGGLVGSRVSGQEEVGSGLEARRGPTPYARGYTGRSQ